MAWRPGKASYDWEGDEGKSIVAYQDHELLEWLKKPLEPSGAAGIAQGIEGHRTQNPIERMIRQVSPGAPYKLHRRIKRLFGEGYTLPFMRYPLPPIYC